MKVKDILGVNKLNKKRRGSRFPRRRGKSLLEGGAMKGVGAIHISEIEPTLKQLEKALGIDLMNNTLGSVGKKEFSGDIDVALEISRDELPTFIAKLKKSNLILDIAQSSVVMTKVKIVDYDKTKETNRPRTGYVQVDFMPGDPAWLKTFYHSPKEGESNFTGGHRNAMLATIAATYNRTESEEKTDDGRALTTERYLYSSSKGLVRITRSPVAKASGGYLKKTKDTVIDGPWKTGNDIASELNLGTADDLYSVETMLDAVYNNYDEQTRNKVFDAIAESDFFKDAKFDVQNLLKHVTEAAYDGNIGMIEMLKFYKIASPGQVDKLKSLIASKKTSEAWELLKKVTGVELKDL